jgi:DNA-binding response OmpR family regulator
VNTPDQPRAGPTWGRWPSEGLGREAGGTARPRVLVVEDDLPTLNLLDLWLQKDGYEVEKATSGPVALRVAYDAHPEAIVLDVMMPGMDGLEVCRRIRHMTEAPILILSARGKSTDIIAGLEAGADDYIVKPFVYAELRARLEARLRRRPPAPEAESNDGRRALWLTDPPRHLVFVNQCAVQLTPKEFDVLQYMARYLGKVVAPDAILANVWGPEFVGERHLLKQYIYRLRAKVEPNSRRPKYLLTVRGSGYVLEPPS